MATNAQTRVSLAKVAEYVETLTRDPASRVFVPLAEIYRQAGMLDEARSVILKGLRHNPDLPQGYVALGRTLAGQNVPDKAEKAFRKAIQLDPRNLQALKGVLRILWQQGDKAGAAKAAGALLDVKPADRDAQAILQRISEQEARKRSSGGQEHGEGDGEEPIKTATLAEIYVRQGLYEKALNVYREILSRNPDNEEIKRKAVAVKKRLEEQAASSGEGAPDEDAPSAGSQPQPAQEPVPGAQEPAAAAQAADETEGTPLEVLEGWLDSIRKRREHVQ